MVEIKLSIAKKTVVEYYIIAFLNKSEQRARLEKSETFATRLYTLAYQMGGKHEKQGYA